MTEVICILCPTGCRLRVRGRASPPHTQGVAESLEIKGAACERGRLYALSEATEPMRVFTGTVRVLHGERPVVAVRSDRPVPHESLLDVARLTARVVVEAPVRAGDTLVDASAEAHEAGVGATAETARAGAAMPGGARLIATADVGLVTPKNRD